MIDLSKFIQSVSDILDIPCPKLSNDTSRFRSPTQLGATNGDTLYLKESYTVSLDLFFTVAHDLRHIWQIKKIILLNHTAETIFRLNTTTR